MLLLSLCLCITSPRSILLTAIQIITHVSPITSAVLSVKFVILQTNLNSMYRSQKMKKRNILGTHLCTQERWLGVYFATVHRCVPTILISRHWKYGSHLESLIEATICGKKCLKNLLPPKCYILFTHTDTINIGFALQTSRSFVSSIQTKRYNITSITLTGRNYIFLPSSLKQL
jgi:hypothetical protein